MAPRTAPGRVEAYNKRFVGFVLHALSGDDEEMRDLLDWPQQQPIWTGPAERLRRACPSCTPWSGRASMIALAPESGVTVHGGM